MNVVIGEIFFIPVVTYQSMWNNYQGISVVLMGKVE